MSTLDKAERRPESSVEQLPESRNGASAPRRSRWAILVVAAAVVLALILAFDWNWLRRPLEAYVTHKTHRDFTISGLSVRLGWTPTIRLRDVVFANAPWASDEPMASIARAEFSISVPDLFRGRIVVPDAMLADGDLRFEHLADGRKNWIFAPPDDTSPSRVRIGSVSMSRCALEYVDHGLSLVLAAIANDVDAANGSGRYKTRYRFHGRYRDAVFHGDLLTGSAASFQDEAAKLPMKGQLVAGTTILRVEGAIADIANTGAADLKLRITGETLANLYPFLLLPLPASPPYRIEGRLLHTDSRFDLHDIQGLIGSTDVAGTAAYLDRQPRPLLRVTLHSDLLNAADLGPLIGVTTKTSPTTAPPTQAQTMTREAAKAQERQATGDRILPAGLPDDTLLPSGQFEGGRLRAIDADAELRAKRIVAPDQLAAGNVHVRVRLRDGVIVLTPFDFELAGGRIVSAIEVDARQPTLAARMNVDFQQLQLGQLLPRSSIVVESQGLLEGELALNGTGNSVADVAANSDGSVSLALAHAQISNLVDAAAGLNGGKVLKLLLGGDKNIPVRCGAAAFSVHDGEGKSEVFVVDTEQTRIDGGGTLDFGNEQFDLTIAPQPKHASILSLRTPVLLRGTFRHPGYELDKKGLALRAGGAIALGLLTPAAAFVPLIETGPGKDVDCARLTDAVLRNSTQAAR